MNEMNKIKELIDFLESDITRSELDNELMVTLRFYMSLEIHNTELTRLYSEIAGELRDELDREINRNIISLK